MLVGVIDSGIGGLNVLKEIDRTIFACQLEYLYLGDREHAPYGRKTKTSLIARLAQIVHSMVECGADCILLACNTATATALEKLKAMFPIPIIGILPQIDKKNEGDTLIFCTPLTAKIIAPRYPAATVVADGLLSKIIEDSAPDFDKATPYIRALAAPFANKGKFVYLACTHYPFAANSFKSVFPDKTILYGYNAAAAALLSLAPPCATTPCPLNERLTFHTWQQQRELYQALL